MSLRPGPAVNPGGDEPSPVELVGSRVRLCLPPTTAAASVLAYYWTNREHLAPWSPPAPPGFHTEEFWHHRLLSNRAEYLEDSSLRLFVFAKDAEQTVIGNVSFTNFRRGPLQATNLGYGLGAMHVGQGLMTEAIELALRFVFGRLAMHRIEANYIAENVRSGRLLQRLGFVVEGFARDYLFIDGRWRDHVLTSLTNPELQRPGMSRGA